jgi:hypothetical protein
MAKKRLKNLEDCRRYLAGLVNRTESGEIEPQLAGKLGYLVNILISAIKDSDLERRIEEIETHLEGRK